MKERLQPIKWTVLQSTTIPQQVCYILRYIEIIEHRTSTGGAVPHNLNGKAGLSAHTVSVYT